VPALPLFRVMGDPVKPLMKPSFPQLSWLHLYTGSPPPHLLFLIFFQGAPSRFKKTNYHALELFDFTPFLFDRFLVSSRWGFVLLVSRLPPYATPFHSLSLLAGLDSVPSSWDSFRELDGHFQYGNSSCFFLFSFQASPPCLDRALRKSYPGRSVP